MLTYGKRLYIRGATFHIWDNVFEKYFPLLRFQFSKFWIIYKKNPVHCAMLLKYMLLRKLILKSS